MINYVKQLDMFGESVSFYIGSDKKMRTVLGGILTPIYFTIYMYLFIIFGQNSFYKINPNYRVERKIISDYNNYSLLKNNFFFAFHVENIENNYQNTSGILEFEAYITKVIDGKYSNISLNITSCDREIEKYTKANLANFRCLNLSESLILKGNSDISSFSFLTFNINLCDLYNKSSRCISNLTTLINENYYYVSILTNRISINFDDKDNPMLLTSSKFWYTIDFQTSKLNSIYFSNVTVINDKGWLFKDQKVYQGIDVDRSDYEFQMRKDQKDRHLMNLWMVFDR